MEYPNEQVIEMMKSYYQMMVYTDRSREDSTRDNLLSLQGHIDWYKKVVPEEIRSSRHLRTDLALAEAISKRLINSQA